MKNDQVCTVLLLLPGLCMALSASVRSPEQRDVCNHVKAGFNDRLRSHDLVAFKYASVVRLGLPSRVMI